MLLSDDRVGIILDPFNDKRSGYMFELNPNGVRLDGLFNSPTEFAPEWDGIWHGDAQLTDDGYTVEIAIPFKTLSFDATDDTWGLNVWREVTRNEEQSGWVSYNRAFNPAASGEIHGMRDMNIGLGLDLMPSMSLSRRKDLNTGEEDVYLEPSLDISYRITPYLNGLLTYNTDFSATEIDDRQVNLSRFSLFFPEKRDFFLKDSDIFEFGNTGNEGPFFSRRIGLSPLGEPVDLEFGGKVSGRIGQWNVGALAIRQDSYRLFDEDIDPSNLLVARVARNFLQESSIGGIVTYGDPSSNLDNALAGVDFRYLNTRLPGGRVLTGEAWLQKTYTEGRTGDDLAWGLGLHMPNRDRWNGGFSYKEFQANYNPALGFITRRGVRDFNAGFNYIYRPDNSWLREISTGMSARHVTRLADDKLQSQFLFFRLLNLADYQGDQLQFRLVVFKEGLEYDFLHPIPAKDVRAGKEVLLPRGLYSYQRYGIFFTTSPARPLSFTGEIFKGSYFDGRRLSLTGTLSWRPSRHFNLYAYIDQNNFHRKGVHFITRLMSFKTDYVFSNTLSWTNTLQFDNVSDNLGFNSRLHWNPRAGQDVYLVFNHNFVDSEDGFRSTASDLTLKANYLFRF